MHTEGLEFKAKSFKLILKGGSKNSTIFCTP